MNYKHEITVLKPIAIDDGYGGETVEYAAYTTIEANTAPYEEKVVTADGSIKIYSLLKVFTRYSIELEDFRIIYEGLTYKLVSKTDYTKVILYKMERV